MAAQRQGPLSRPTFRSSLGLGHVPDARSSCSLFPCRPALGPVGRLPRRRHLSPRPHRPHGKHAAVADCGPRTAAPERARDERAASGREVFGFATAQPGDPTLATRVELKPSVDGGLSPSRSVQRHPVADSTWSIWTRAF